MHHFINNTLKNRYFVDYFSFYLYRMQMVRYGQLFFKPRIQRFTAQDTGWYRYLQYRFCRGLCRKEKVSYGAIRKTLDLLSAFNFFHFFLSVIYFFSLLTLFDNKLFVEIVTFSTAVFF
jgi:hypothetical protein